MAVPKKRTSTSKRRIRINIWKKKGSLAALKAFSLAKSVYVGRSKSFLYYKKVLNIKVL
uniref:Large ribosomal subunit protein bL32c n=1 Tax=Vanilla madagascariensis TaxID=669896 RepID=A0A6G7KXW3_9ASPA|nr:ribosomal protein L32 [Vanilla madagascariensis]QII90194.1 ribosomal protein L32 [Vanilla madagascariensis]